MAVIADACFGSSSFDGTSRLWDSVTGECLRVFQDHKRLVYALAFSPDARFFATGGADGWLHVYDVKVGPFLTFAQCMMFMRSERPAKNVGRGTLALRSLASLRLTGSNPGISTEWHWPLNRTKSVWLTLHEYRSSNKRHLSPDLRLLFNMHVLLYCSSLIVIFLRYLQRCTVFIGLFTQFYPGTER